MVVTAGGECYKVAGMYVQWELMVLRRHLQHYRVFKREFFVALKRAVESL